MNFLQAYVPGFEDSYLLETGAQVGVRESRRLKGQTMLTTDAVVRGARSGNVVARNGYQIDIHDPDGKELMNEDLVGGAYDIPYGALVSADLDNVLVAGRAISCSIEAFGSLRTTPSCMAIGHAAGVAAALAADAQRPLAEVPVADVQERLMDQNAELGLG